MDNHETNVAAVLGGNSGNNIDDDDDEALQEQCHAELMDFLTNNPDMRTAARNSLKQGLWAGGSAVAGGLVFGPVGGMVGGIAGSIIGYARAEQDGGYDGIVQQLYKLQPGARRNRLVQAIWNILHRQQQHQQQSTNGSSRDVDDGEARNASLSPQAFQTALVELAAQPRIREQIWQVCMDVANDSTSSDEYGSTFGTELTSE